ncbi:spore germination lipoprotein GerD [Priestia megaterium]|uniref:spore germination lipoprotein GerD n=1 Tax=Priestia megaterium TaxID=1404 RepID=UPI00215E7612|nr:spore germination lipoprotein GerD [Priestia megaterium]MCR8926802.1 spore germination lipoprotein GerD [Priestia megaterium]
MKKRLMLLIYIGMCMLLATACAPQDEENNSMDYDQTKKMVVDILKTDEGKKAVEAIMKDPSVRQDILMDQNAIKDTISQTLVSDKGVEFWKKAMDDPKFAESFAKSLEKENKTVIKQLMKDPEYQGMLQDVLKDPAMEKEVLTVLKSKEYRTYLQKIMTETFDSPLYQSKIQDILLKAAEETQGGQKQSSDDGGSSSSGSDSGGEQQQQ